MKSSKVIVACMRNEALYVVEWVAHHLALGFDRIVVYTNDCDDGTDRLLALLGQDAPVEHHPNPGPYDTGSIQKQALHLAYQLDTVRQAEWALHIDADELVNVTAGQRRIDDLIALHPGADAIAVMWRHFGSAGKATWEGGSIVESFTRCEDPLPDLAAGGPVGFKTLFRPRAFGMMGVHTPKLPQGDAPPGVVNAAGVPMPVDKLFSLRGSDYEVAPHHLTWENACLHHHHVRSDDLHRMKRARGDANGRRNGKRKIGSAFYHASNRNDVESLSLVELRPQVRIWESRLRAIPGVAEIETSAWEWFRIRYQSAESEGS